MVKKTVPLTQIFIFIFSSYPKNIKNVKICQTIFQQMFTDQMEKLSFILFFLINEKSEDIDEFFASSIWGSLSLNFCCIIYFSTSIF